MPALQLLLGKESVNHSSHRTLSKWLAPKRSLELISWSQKEDHGRFATQVADGKRAAQQKRKRRYQYCIDTLFFGGRKGDVLSGERGSCTSSGVKNVLQRCAIIGEIG
jgi:hypothetical protein